VSTREAHRSALVPYLYIGTTVFFWGTQYWAIEIASGDAPAVMITALRTVPAALVLVLAVVILGARFPPRELWLWASVTGLLMVALTLGGISEGAARAGGGIAAVLVNTSPFFVVALGGLFLRERMSWSQVVGLVLGFAGVVLIVSPQLDSGADTGDLALGMGLALASAVAFAVGTLMVKARTERNPELDLLGLTAVQYVVGGAALTALAFGVEPVDATEWDSGDLWGAIAWISIGGSALAYLTFLAALKRLPASIVSASLFLVPVIAVIVDVARGRVPEAIVLSGMALAVIGVALVNVPASSLERRLGLGSEGR
jgi:drug/metabolite transporter (DMT)-like permease